MGGGRSSQSVMQQSTTQQTSTTNANQYYTVSLNQSGLTSSQVNQLISQASSPQAELYTVLAGVGQGAASGSPVVIIVVLLLFAALIFRR